MKVVDAFIFYNEFDVLEYRLETLYDEVDHFILVESNQTHTGDEKPLYFTIHKKRYQKYLDKITHIIVTDFPENLTQEEINELVAIPEIRNMNWVREHHQRRAISRGIDKLNLQPEDIIMISDVDEIPDMNKIDEISELLNHQPLVCEQRWFIWNTDWEKNFIWGGTSIISKQQYDDNNDIIQHLRNIRWDDPVDFKRIYCGWHLSWFGNPSFIKDKMFSFAHSETASNFFFSKKNIANLIREGLPPETPKGSTEKLKRVEGGYLPPNPEKLTFFNVDDYPKRYDCIIYNGELELLEMRINELNHQMDFFVILETTYTYDGRKIKPTLKNELWRFKEFDDKIIYAVIEEPEDILDDDPYYHREAHHRNSLTDVLKHLGVRDTDYIFISNTDEVPDSRLIESNIFSYDYIEYEFLTLRQRHFVWNFDFENNNHEVSGTQMCSFKNLKLYSAQYFRDRKHWTDYYLKTFRGWKMEYFGTPERSSELIKRIDPDYLNEGLDYFQLFLDNQTNIWSEPLYPSHDWFYFPMNKIMLEEKLFPNQNKKFLFDLIT
jgi:beta-1,4-mannosyl-glycoprotein beta-1,4-N-acetylglucosaminyltransferase